VAAVAAPAGPPAGDYVVRGPDAAVAVSAAGGRVLASLDMIGAVEARLSSAAVLRLEGLPATTLTPDAEMKAVGASYGGGEQAAQLARMDLGGLWSGHGGAGVGVALIDTGIAATPGLTKANLVESPDFSGSNRHGDEYGHGTFMAGLIAGNGSGGPGAVPGVAPGVRLVSVKVAGADGSTTLAKVIEGIQWAVDHRVQYDIRVMSISFGADLGVAPQANPLDAAVEIAWASGIAVVAAAGNEGAGHVTSPGDDPWVITVGAETTSGPQASTEWSGSTPSKPDVLAPGVSIVSLRAPGSYVDRNFPKARVGGLYFRGSGTSMATALTAGMAALLVREHPAATPDDLKGAIIAGSDALAGATGGPGAADALRSDSVAASDAWTQSHPVAFDGFGIGLGPTMPWATGGYTPTGTWTAGAGSSPAWSDVPWATVAWETVSWETVSWETVSWETVAWETVAWETVSWETVAWETVAWETVSWETVSWETVSWEDQGWG
jgi:serine protease AprX